MHSRAQCILPVWKSSGGNSIASESFAKKIATSTLTHSQRAASLYNWSRWHPIQLVRMMIGQFFIYPQLLTSFPFHPAAYSLARL